MLTDVNCVWFSLKLYLLVLIWGGFIDHTGPLARMQEHRAGLLGWR